MALEVQDRSLPVAEATRPYSEVRGNGLVAKLRRINGLTPQGVLDDPFVFQVAPLGTLPINRSYPQTTYDTISGKQRARPGQILLRSVTYQTLFTDTKWPWTRLHGTDYLPNPVEMLAELEDIAESHAYFWLTVRGPGRASYEVSWAASLTDLNSEERDAESDARYVTASFLEYRDSSIQTNRLGGGPRGGKAPVAVQANELPAARSTLYGLARFYYGDPTLWKRIAKFNGLDVAPGYDLRLLGDRKLTIPKRP